MQFIRITAYATDKPTNRQTQVHCTLYRVTIKETDNFNVVLKRNY